MNKLFTSAALMLLLAAGTVSCNSNTEKVAPQGGKTCTTAIETPQQALDALVEGNARYVSNNCIHPNTGTARVAETAPHQEPFAAVVGCSDSRVPVELVFDQGIGDIFVIRTAGNNVGGKMVMGSVEYAVEHLGVKVLLVLGHESCGGVTSAITPGEHGGTIGELLHAIQEDIPEFIGKTEELDSAIHHHTCVQVNEILENPVVAHLVQEGKLMVKGAHYDVDSGIVTIK